MILARTGIILLSVAVLGACAGNTPLPKIQYDATAFKPAAIEHDPAAVKTAAALPLPPPQPLPPPDPPKPDLRAPTARVVQANRAALHEPATGDFINAVQIYPFADNALYRLYAAPQQVSDIQFQNGETLSAISAGDTVRWAVGDTTSGSGPSRRVHVLVKPFAAGLKTNLVILTDRRTYHLELVSTDHTSMAAISWSYPQDDLITQVRDSQPPVIESGVSPEDLNFRYAISGDDPPWRPVRAFDDGNKVYIEFPPQFNQDEAPPLFVVGADGSSDLVNYRVRGNYYIVDRLFAAAELRLGTGKQQIVRISRTDAPQSKRSASLFGD
ncbi:MAG TPA: P-type conjugative transfer protein TrbG [Rhizomicrobium sp.]|nr:P-type conjugative transfer protein TrbG [Rhizomicrobium sp.]